MNKPPTLSCICFSKDRPLQLEGYIQSLAAHASEPVALTVLHHASDKRYQDAYGKLAGLYPEARFLQERNFRRQVTRWVKDAGTPLVMFGCDDVVFKDDFDLGAVAEAFQDSGLFGFSLRLGLELSYCATRRRTQPRPRFLRREPWLLWDWPQASYDWGYPFELCCTVYRREWVERFLASLDEVAAAQPGWPDWGHPNRLEALGDKLSGQLKAFPRLASFPDAKGIVVTVNRVQEVCKNFVYGGGGLFGSEALLELWENGMVVDVEAYRGRKYHAVHVGELRLRHRQRGEVKLDNAAEYDLHKVIITDFAQSLVSAKHALLGHARLPDFVRQFDEYFHLEGAETSCPVVVSPRLDGPPPEPAGQAAWLAERRQALGPANVVAVDGGAAARAGLGVDGEPLAPRGAERFFREAGREVAPGGHLVGAAPIAQEPFVMFNAGRVFRREDVLAFFPDFEVAAERHLYPEPGPPERLGELPDLTACVWCFDLKRKA